MSGRIVPSAPAARDLRGEVAVLDHPGQLHHPFELQLAPPPADLRRPQGVDQRLRLVLQLLRAGAHGARPARGARCRRSAAPSRRRAAGPRRAAAPRTWGRAARRSPCRARAASPASAAAASLIRPSASATNCSLFAASASADSARNAWVSSASRRASSCSRPTAASRSARSAAVADAALGLGTAQAVARLVVLGGEVVQPLQQARRARPALRRRRRAG